MAYELKTKKMGVIMKLIILIIFIGISILYLVFFRKRGFIQFKLFWDRSERLYNQKVTMGTSPHQALKEISIERHPELSEHVHSIMVRKFDDINVLINFIWFGLEKHLSFYKKEFTDENALNLVNGGRVIQKAPNHYIVVINSEKK